MLAKVFGAVVAAFVVLVGVVEATGLDGAAGGGEVDVPAVGAASVAARVDLVDRQRLVGHLAGVDDAAFVQAAVEGPDVVGIAACARDLGEESGFGGA